MFVTHAVYHKLNDLCVFVLTASGVGAAAATKRYETDQRQAEETVLVDSYVEKEKRTEAPRMGSMFRSEEMALCQLFIQPEAAYSAVAAMGEAGVVQFRDVSVSSSSVNVFDDFYTLRVANSDAETDVLFVPVTLYLRDAGGAIFR